MSKTLLILAASRYQMDAIRTAQRLGHRVITTDNTPDNPGHAIADQAFGIDITDREGVLELARAEHVDGILSPCTDVAVPTAAYVAEELGLIGPPLEATKIVTDKIAFRHFLEQHNLPRPRYHQIEADAPPPAHLWDKAAAWVIKPDRSSGSKGIFIVRSAEELASRLAESRAFSPTGRVLVEEYIHGHQGTVEGVLKDGRITLHFVLDRQTAPAPYVTTTGHRLPSQLPAHIQQQVIDHLEHVWALLGVRQGVFDADFVHGNGTVYLIEITPRLGGNSISQLIRQAAGVDLVELAVQHACDHPVAPPVVTAVKPTAVVLLGVWQHGLLHYGTARAATLRQLPWVTSLEFDVPPGSSVEPFINGRHRVGEAYLTAATAADLPALEQTLKAELNLEVLPA